MCSPNFCAIQLDQPAAVLVLLLRHVRETWAEAGKSAQSVGVVGVDARVLLFGRDGQGQDLLLRQAVHVPHGNTLPFELLNLE